MTQTVESSDAAEVVVDLGGLEFIDVRGLSLLSRLARRLDSSGRSLRLADTPPLVRHCCELLGFDLVTAGAAR